MAGLIRFASTCAILALVASSGAASDAESTLGPAALDPKGADFTSWMTHFKTQMYQHWVVPPPLPKGTSLQVKLRLVIGREGTIKNVRVLRRSGDAQLDAAAKPAVRGSSLLPLPETYPDQSIARDLPITNVGREKK
jgi:TonB family protein